MWLAVSPVEGVYVSSYWLCFFNIYFFWRRKWQPSPVLLLGKCHGRRSLVGYIPWGHKESDTTKWRHICLFLTFQSYRTCLGASPPSTILMSILGLKIRILHPPQKKNKTKNKNSGTLKPGAITEIFIFFYFLYLAAPGLSCGMRTLSCSMGELVPQLGIELGPLLWEHGATGPPGKSPHFTDFGLDHFSCFGQWNVNRYDSCHVWTCEFILSCSSLLLEWA